MRILPYLLPELFKAGKTPSNDSNALPELIRVTVEAIVEVLLLCLVGYILGRRGTIDSRIKRSLNKLNQNLFTPCLLFGKVAFSLTPSKLAELWIVPVGFVIVSVVSALLAYGMGTIFRLSKSQRAFAVACATFMNSNSLPIALMQSLTYTVDGLKWGPHDTRDAMLGRALSYLVLFSTLGIVLRWSYGIKLLSTADDEAPKEGEENGDIEQQQQQQQEGGENAIESEERHDSATPLLISTDYAKQGPDGTPTPVRRSSRFSDGPVTVARPPGLTGSASSSQPAKVQRPGQGPVRRWTVLGNSEEMGEDVDYFQKDLAALASKSKKDRQKNISDFRSFPNTPSRTPAASSYATSGSENDSSSSSSSIGTSDPSDDDEQYAGTGRNDLTKPSRSAWQSRVRKQRRKCWHGTMRWVISPVRRFIRGVKAFMTAPLYAALLSLIVACIPPVQRELDQMLPLRNAIKSAGNCSVPITLLVLGSYFVEEPDPAPKPSESKNARTPSQLRRQKRKERKRALKKQPSMTESLRNKFGEMFEGYKQSRKERKQRMKEKTKKGEGRTVFVAVVSRMVVAPLVLIPLLAWWSIKTVNIADDGVFLVTAVLVIGSAPAITLAQLTTAAGASFERLISRTLFISYAIVTFPSTIVLVLLGLEIAKRQ